MIQPNCSECDRLWKAYLRVRREHLRIQGSLRAAMESCNAAAAEQLRPLAAEAWAHRLVLRETLRAHGLFDHPRTLAAVG